MYKVIVNKTFESDCTAFEERFDGISKVQNLTISYMGVSQNFSSEWKKIAEKTIESIDFYYNDKLIVGYTAEQYNLLQTVIVRAVPEDTILEGTVSFTFRNIE